MLTKEKKLEIISLIQRADNRRDALIENNISYSTFKRWRKKYNEEGIEGLENKIFWTEEEDERLIDLASNDIQTKEILKIFQHRTSKSIEARLKKLNLSLNKERIEYREKFGKKCSVCGNRKNLEEYYEAIYESIDGKQSQCKECFLASNKEYRKKNEKEIKIKRKLHYKEQKKIAPEKNKLWHREYVKTAKGLFMVTKKRIERGKNRKYIWEISWDEFEVWYDENAKKKCDYCGITIEDYLRVRKKLVKSAQNKYNLTIDRKDSKKTILWIILF